MKILVAVDGSKHSLHAVEALVDHADWYREQPQVELVTVHLPVPKLPRMGAAVGKKQIAAYYKQEGEARLASARRKPDAARFPAQGKPKSAATDPDGPWELMTAEDRLIVQRIMANTGKAIEAYERLLVSRNSAFDRFTQGETDALSASARR